MQNLTSKYCQRAPNPSIWPTFLQKGDMNERLRGLSDMQNLTNVCYLNAGLRLLTDDDIHDLANIAYIEEG